MTSGTTAGERWRRVKQLTFEALERPESERPSWLAEACAGDDALRREVESLLTAHADAGEFLETPGLAKGGAAEAVAAAFEGSLSIATGRSIGPYRIVRELGHGGMGVVYLAERADAVFEKNAAIKVVRGGFAGSSLMERFRDERRILATLDHPNIARLLDGGATDDGLPYFVMEYVDGIPLDVYCETKGLSLAQRLALFRQVCAAAQYAHQRLVIHRDLKARNILVTADGTPKLLDFGIAKLLEPGLAMEGQTRTGFRALTLEGASPEQVRGEPMTVTSDVYSLGVLLYRLLTGQGPYGASPRKDAELMRAICEELPARPSAVVPASRRAELPGEIDWIVLKALRKEPERRYASVEQFADDIGRHLSGRPVLAAPDSWRYRARKFALRHRTAVAAGVLLSLSLVAGVSTTLWQARRAEEQRARAERRFNDVRKLANSFLFEFDEAIKDLPGSTPARSLVVKRALEYLDSLSTEAQGDRSLQRELATAYERVGTVQGNPTVPNLGDSQGALRSYRKALAIREVLAAAEPSREELQLELASTYGEISDVLMFSGDTAGAARHSGKALAVYEALEQSHSSNPKFQRDLVFSTYRHANLLGATGDLEQALAKYRRAAELSHGLIAAKPSDPEGLDHLAVSLDGIGRILQEKGDVTGALEHGRRTLEIRKRLAAADPNDAHYRRQLGFAHHNLGLSLVEAGDLDQALRHFREELGLFESLHATDPTDTQGRRNVSLAHKQIGDVLARTSNLKGALDHYGKALAIDRDLSAADAANAQALFDLSLSEGEFGCVLGKLGRTEDGLALIRKAAKAQELLAIKDPHWRSFAAASQRRLADCLPEGGRRSP